MAEYYSANLSQNVKRGFRENALKGKWNGGTIPLGYKVVDHRLTIDEETAPIVRLIFDMCAGGKTAKEIYNYLTRRKLSIKCKKLLKSSPLLPRRTRKRTTICSPLTYIAASAAR